MKWSSNRKGINDAVFSHKFHLDMDYKCDTCHVKVFPYKGVSGRFTMADMEKGKVMRDLP